MTNLTAASQELFRRGPDECFGTLDALHDFCRRGRDESRDIWQKPDEIKLSDKMSLLIGEQPSRLLNDWSFSQVCRMAGVSKDTINRLSPRTASLALDETLPRLDKPLQLLTTNNLVRSVHGVAYTRLWNAELLDAVRDVATDFTPPQVGCNGGTGLYCGEQDLFTFLIDPLGWVEIGGETFAPGFFVWNSEVGRRSLGIQTGTAGWCAADVSQFSVERQILPCRSVRRGGGFRRCVRTTLFGMRSRSWTSAANTRPTSAMD